MQQSHIETMVNFTIGPVSTSEEVRKIGMEQVPYFRTPEFSEMMLDNERIIRKLAKAPEGSRAVFLTGSGTSSMEASVINFLSEQDRVLVIDGGTFGHRFVELLEINDIPHTVIRPDFGCDITASQLMEYEGRGYTGFLVNLDETSIGVLYNIELISSFCKRNGLLLIVDSISSFLCDSFDMEKLGVDVMITSSQKALACPPGISVIVMNDKAVKRALEHSPKTLYLDLKLALKDGERGQTPFTPAVSILRQLNVRLRQIEKNGGADVEVDRTRKLASHFRKQLQGLPLSIVSNSLSNAVTPLMVRDGILASDVFRILKDEYGIWICPNGGALKDKIFRVGHLGDLQFKDYDILIDAFKDLLRRGLL